jgi:catechol-2,3-dioxygenase
MAGIIFFATKKYAEIKSFYLDKLGLELWLDQGGCAIFRSDNLLLGFCERNFSDAQGCITIFFSNREQVDSTYSMLSDIADAPPRENQEYKIYHFWAKDPEGRTLEFQSFDDPIPAIFP